MCFARQKVPEWPAGDNGFLLIFHSQLFEYSTFARQTDQRASDAGTVLCKQAGRVIKGKYVKFPLFDVLNLEIRFLQVSMVWQEN